MFEIGFLCPKGIKEMEKSRGREEKASFGGERNGLQALVVAYAINVEC